MREPVVYLDGELLTRQEWRRLPPVVYRRVLAMSGAMILAASGAIIPVLHVYTSGTSVTETIPNNVNTVTIEVWGGGGASGGNNGSATGGGGGGAGGYSRCTITVGAQNGKTFTYTVGAAGTTTAANGNPGGNSTVVAGTITGFNTITCNGGNGGTAGNNGGTLGSGGTVTDTNAGATNTTGANGTAGNAGAGGTGGTGTTGTVSGDGSPYGGGGNPGRGPSASGNGFIGVTGAIVFSYT
jgi:hypothetical protein